MPTRVSVQPFAVYGAAARVPLGLGNAQEVEVDAVPCEAPQPATPKTEDPQAEMMKLAEKLSNPNLSDKQREQLMTRLEKLQQEVMKQQEAMLARLSDPKEIQRQEQEKKAQEEARQKKLREICRSLTFAPAEDGGVQGTAYCDDWKLAGAGRYGRMPLKGTVKYLGP